MIFTDRKEAGKRLALELHHFQQSPATVVIALPRGGVVVGYEVAQALSLPLDIISPRKIGAPFNPELAIGAITETGEKILFTDLIEQLGVSQEYIQKAIVKEQEEAKRRLHYYRKNRKGRAISGKKVILVDDGLATGATMLAAIQTVRAEKAQQIIVAVPVAPAESVEKIAPLVDSIVCLSTPADFYAVGQFYNHFDQTSDQEVIQLLEESV